MLTTMASPRDFETGVFGIVFVLVATRLTNVHAVLQLPNTTGIDGHLTANHSVDNFFSLWLVFNNDDVRISDKPFTIFAPQNSQLHRVQNLLQQPDLVKKLVLDQVVLGTRLNLTNILADISLPTLGGNTVTIKAGKEGVIKANNATIIEKDIGVPNGILIVVDSYLFPEDEPMTSNQSRPSAMFPQNAKQANIKPLSAVLDTKLPAPRNQSNTSFVENVMEGLSFIKSHVRVFQHFLSSSNVSHLLKEGEEYTVFVPLDHAFQRWHPIDWGFYPFSVPEFTESVIVNHFVRGRLKQDSIKDGQKMKTLGEREIIFKRNPSFTVNDATIVKGDISTDKGNIMLIAEVLFVSESVVSKLHQQHKDKETPPLLAFPWFGAQFLSHAFLALERDERFTHIARFLNLADLAPHVSGAGYTFFVPTDTAFEELGLDKMPDNYLSNGEGLQILLNHFVKGRLYDKDLKDGSVLRTLGNETLVVNRTKVNVHVNEALIVESEVFVYNLGTMFYIDTLLFNTIKVPNVPIAGNPNTTSKTSTSNATSIAMTTSSIPPSTPADNSTITFTPITSSKDSIRDIEHVTEKGHVEKDPEVLFGDGTLGSNVDIEYTTLPSVQNTSLPNNN